MREMSHRLKTRGGHHHHYRGTARQCLTNHFAAHIDGESILLNGSSRNLSRRWDSMSSKPKTFGPQGFKFSEMRVIRTYDGTLLYA